MLLIRNATVYTPEFSGEKDILIWNRNILEISGKIEMPSDFDVEVFDAIGLLVVPGLIDSHVPFLRIHVVRFPDLMIKGMDADLLFLNQGFEMVHLIALGQWVVKDRKVLKKGTYDLNATGST
jgi:N-acetylglucosamine-6-phosphate deacetylase